MFSEFEAILLSLIHTLPLELFVFVASFIEEVIAPIPSLAVLLLTGSFAAIQERTVIELIPLAIIAALGKTIGAIIVYYFSEKIGNLMLTKFGRFFDISPEAVKTFSESITGTPRDYLLLTLFRALPILPSSVVSISCGLLKIPLRLFIVTTVIGTIVRDSIFLYAGYQGTQLLGSLATHSATIESFVQMTFLTCVALVLVYLYLRRRRLS